MKRAGGAMAMLRAKQGPCGEVEEPLSPWGGFARAVSLGPGREGPGLQVSRVSNLPGPGNPRTLRLGLLAGRHQQS